MIISISTITSAASPAATAAADPIDSAALQHDSRADLYRTPGGAVTFGAAVTLRLRAAAGDLDAVNMRILDMRTQTQTVWPLTIVATTPDGYDFWETQITAGAETTIYYYRFILQRGGETLYYEDDTFTDAGEYVASNKGGVGAVYPVSRDANYQIAVYDPAFYTPEWVRNGIIYQIFPDRFRDGDPANNPTDGSDVFYGDFPLLFHETWNEPPVDGRVTTLPDGRGYWNSDFYGGDLAGITEKLDYLQSLGVTGIYLNPIFAARSNHRYDTADFLAVDPLLGTMDDFQTLIAETQARDMYIILDGVFNHMSSDSPYFDRYQRYDTVGACESVDSEYRDWFYFREPRGTESAPCAGENGNLFYDSWWNFDSIPRINNTLYGPRAYFVRGRGSVAHFWGAAGIGGWRMDVAGDIDNGRDPENNYWEMFRTVVRNENPEAIIIGEEWQDATPWLLGDQWDSSMNYRFRRAAIGLIRGANFTDNDGIIPALTPYQFDNAIRSVAEDYPPMAYQAMINLIGSHDTSRIFFVMNNDVELLQLTALLQFTLPGAPTIYYGDEIALDAPSQPEGTVYQDDPYNRAPYPWPDVAGDYYPSPNEEVLAFYQTLGQMRTANSALREGAMITLRADDTVGIYAFLRIDATEGNAALVVLNTGDEAQTVDLNFGGLLPNDLSLTAVFSGATLSTNTGTATVNLTAHSGEVWTGDIVFAAPAAPTTINATGATGSVTVTWETAENAAGYIVYRSPVAVGGFQPVSASVADTTFTDADVVNGFVYYYAVASVGANGLIGNLSASTPATPAYAITAAQFAADTPAETSITLAYGAIVPLRATLVIDGVTGSGESIPGLRAQAALAGADAEVLWLPMNYVGAENGGDIYEAALTPLAAGEYTLRARFSADAGQSWTEATLADGTTPRLIVVAPEDTEPPASPADFTISQASMNGVTLVWSPVADAELAAYRIYRTLAGVTTLLVELGADATEYTDTAVLIGSTYTYAIAAVDHALNESERTTTREVLVDRALIPVTFLVNVPENTAGTLYLAGDLGMSALPLWDPAGIEMTEISPNVWAVTLDLREGLNLQYKFTRGSWDGVEKGTECEEIANRRLTVSLDTLGEMSADGTYVVEHTIAKWRDLDACP